MIAKIIFILSYIIFLIGLTIFRKTDKTLNIIRYLIFQIMLTMVFNAILVALPSLFGFGTAPMFISSILGIIGVILIIITMKRKRFQKYEFRWVDLISSLLILGVALLVGLRLFGPELHLAYNNVDPSVHFYMAQNNLFNGEHSGMFFYEINNAITMNGLSIFTDSAFLNYKLYLIIEIGMLALSGLMLYALISQWAKNKTQSGACLVTAILYMLGYSLNNMIYGFGYLGVSVTLICFIIIACKALWDKKISLKMAIPLLSMSVFCIAICYMLFAPIIWIIVTIVIFAYCRKNKFKFKKFALIELGIFAIPLILAIKFCYVDFILKENLEVSDQIRANGAHYANYIKNAALFLPPALYAFYQNIKKKNSFVTTFFAISWLIFFALAVIAREFGLISPYYCSKLYHVAWLVTFIMFADGTLQLLRRAPKTTIAYSAAILVFFSCALFNHGGPLVDLYKLNFSWVKTHRTIDEQTMEGYRFASNEILAKGEKIVWATNLNQYDRAYWFYGTQVIETNKYDYYQAWRYNAAELANKMKENDINYIGIFKLDPESYASYNSLLKGRKVVFENNDVAIYK